MFCFYVIRYDNDDNCDLGQLQLILKFYTNLIANLYNITRENKKLMEKCCHISV